MEKKKILLMGVSGSGKSLIGQKVAEALDIPFFDGDDFHPQENVEKMRQGIPLSDEDRQGWLHTLNQLFIKETALIVACSALKKEYRKTLADNNEAMTIVYLQGNFETIWERHQKRDNHYFSGENMLLSQFETLEEPSTEEAIFVDVSKNAEDVVTAIVQALEDNSHGAV